MMNRPAAVIAIAGLVSVHRTMESTNLETAKMRTHKPLPRRNL